MKFLLFADLHFAPGVFMGATWEGLRKIQDHAKAAGCEFIIHAGDFCHGVSGGCDDTQVISYIKAYNEFSIPSYHALGNHDMDGSSYEEMIKQYCMPDGHYYFDRNGYRFIVCDPNYFFEDGTYIHYSLRNNAAYGSYCSYMPPEQLAWLAGIIESAPGSCVLISHQSFEREKDGVVNAAEVRRIIRDANQKRPHSVILCINGHYHRDHIRILDNVCYWDVNSASYDWLEKSHSCYPEELCRDVKFLSHTLVYNDPLHAIVTLEGETITIEGMESSTFMGVTSQMTGNDPCDLSGRPTSPVIQSMKLTLG